MLKDGLGLLTFYLLDQVHFQPDFYVAVVVFSVLWTWKSLLLTFGSLLFLSNRGSNMRKKGGELQINTFFAELLLVLSYGKGEEVGRRILVLIKYGGDFYVQSIGF